MLQSNQKGLTLVETLAIIIIMSIVMLFLFNIVASSLNSSKKMQEQANIQSEANYLLVVLREFHERGEDYTISFINGELIIEEDLTSNYRTVFNRYYYEINDKTELIEISPENEEKTFNITIKLTSKKYKEVDHITKTTLQIL